MLNFIRLLCVIVSTSAFAVDLKLEDIKVMKKMLNGQRIQYLFRSYDVEVLHLDSKEFPGSRIANLYSKEGDAKVMRTLAIVDYIDPVDTKVMSEHKEIMGGKPIGKAFDDAGWAVIKEPVFFGELPLSGPVKKWMDVENLLEPKGSLHIYDFKVKREEGPVIPYCKIIEIHSPLYLSKASLMSLYPEEFPKHNVDNQNFSKRLSNFLETEFK